MEHRHDQGFAWYDGARHAHDGWWSGPLHLIVMLLVVGLIVALVVWLVRRYGHLAAAAAAAPAVVADPAIGALRMRYARGEVSCEEYLSRLGDLGGGGTTAADAPTAETAPWPGSAGEGERPDA